MTIDVCFAGFSWLTSFDHSPVAFDSDEKCSNVLCRLSQLLQPREVQYLALCEVDHKQFKHSLLFLMTFDLSVRHFQKGSTSKNKMILFAHETFSSMRMSLYLVLQLDEVSFDECCRVDG